MQKIEKQVGFTLVELMVSLVLGILLTAAVVQSYLSSKQTYRATEGISRIQENARFSLHFLTKELRNAGYSGCIGRIRNKLNGYPNDYIKSTASVTSWDYTGTNSGDNAFVLSGDSITLPTSANSWSNSTSGISLPSYLTNRVALGSDVLWFKYFKELDIIIKHHEDDFVAITTKNTHKLENDSIMLVGDCSDVEMFQYLSQDNNKQISLSSDKTENSYPGNRREGGTEERWARTYNAEDSLYSFVQTFYYIGEGASGLPSLFRYSTGQPKGAITAADIGSHEEELVEGVETMQLLFGQDTNDEGNPTRYVSGNQITSWENVISVRIGLLIRSPNNTTDNDQIDNYTLLDSIDFTHPEDDKILRYGVNTTVKLRNLGFGKNFGHFVCDSIGEDKNDDNGIPTCVDSYN